MSKNPAQNKASKAAPENKASTKYGPFELSQKISLQKDKEGKAYGKDNNPKRDGSKAAEVFSLYKDGMTVQEAKDAGIPSADIKFNNDKGYLKVA